jgi:DNA gyrase subunit A
MARRRRKKGGGDDQMDLPMASVQDAPLAEETRRRYLSYALSVITSRALPDVRDGLKPVQRRILYTMRNELHLRHDARYRKSAAVVGDVMGKFHPHGDLALYEALVRMAQSFTMRAPLVDGRGNFGSPDGDAPAAMRYTECKLTPLADELLSELGKRTVPFRPNYDGTRSEPVVLPARYPNLLVNGSQGIAVGMATSIPPHNLGEVVDACVALIDAGDIDEKAALKLVFKHFRGPDFPTGGELLSTRAELQDVYGAGQGSLKLRGEWKLEESQGRGNPQIVLTSIPYSLERRTIVEKIAEIIIGRKLPALQDVRDESTDDCRIVCEMKKGADPQLVMAYLYKHTPLQTNVQVNLNCLVPTEQEDVAAPMRLDLVSMLRRFLEFRMQVVTRRLQFDLEKLRERIHILEALVVVFDALDEVIRIIRRSDGRQDAKQKLIKRFDFSETQTDAILDLRLYKLAKLEILVIREELEQKRTEAKSLERLLGSPKERWKLLRAELHELKTQYAEPRRTRILGRVDEPEFAAEDFIVEEDAMVVLTHQGWVKRQQRVRDVTSTRVREGDIVVEVAAGSTRSTVAFFSNMGACYVTRLVDIPQTTGYGVPVQTLFKMSDGERIVSMVGMDPRFLDVPEPTEGAEEPEPPYAIAVTRLGMTLRFSLRSHREPSTRSGRKYARLKKDDDVLYVGVVEEGEAIACATRQGRALICEADEVSLLGGAGKGVMLIRLQKGDEVVGAKVLVDDHDRLVVRREGGNDYAIGYGKYEIVSRAGKGFQLFKRGKVEGKVWQEPTLPGFPAPETNGEGD